MTPLRKRMLDAMMLRGFAKHTQEMGHAHLSTTSRYLKMPRPGHFAGDSALPLLSQLPPIPPMQHKT